MSLQPDRVSRVPRSGWNYIEQLKADFASVAGAGEALPPSMAKASSAFTWGDLYSLEAAILRVEPADNLRRIVWRWRARFRNSAGEVSYRVYLDSKPPEPATDDIAAVRSDLTALATELHYLYLLSPARDQLRDSFFLWSFGGIGLATAVIIFFTLIERYPSLPALAVVMFAGWGGGLISVQERLQRLPDGDPLFRLLQLRGSRWSILLSPVTGAVFAIVLYLCFVAGLVDGTLFPTISTPTKPDPTGLSFAEFTKSTGPAQGLDWAKLLVWSFIAGFAERLVPDLLTRLAASAKTAGDAKSSSS